MHNRLPFPFSPLWVPPGNESPSAASRQHLRTPTPPLPPHPSLLPHPQSANSGAPRAPEPQWRSIHPHCTLFYQASYQRLDTHLADDGKRKRGRSRARGEGKGGEVGNERRSDRGDASAHLWDHSLCSAEGNLIVPFPPPCMRSVSAPGSHRYPGGRPRACGRVARRIRVSPARCARAPSALWAKRAALSHNRLFIRGLLK